MKKLLISSLLLASAGAFAGDASEELQNRTAFQGERTRAAVKAEYMTAKRAGTIADTSEGASSQPQGIQQSTRDRAEVKSEAVQAARAHTPHELF